MIGSPLSFVTAVPLKTAAFFLDILSFRFASLPDCQPEPVFLQTFRTVCFCQIFAPGSGTSLRCDLRQRNFIDPDIPFYFVFNKLFSINFRSSCPETVKKQMAEHLSKDCNLSPRTSSHCSHFQCSYHLVLIDPRADPEHTLQTQKYTCPQCAFI
jgi:hypothetical protein